MGLMCVRHYSADFLWPLIFFFIFNFTSATSPNFSRHLFSPTTETPTVEDLIRFCQRHVTDLHHRANWTKNTKASSVYAVILQPLFYIFGWLFHHFSVSRKSIVGYFQPKTPPSGLTRTSWVNKALDSIISFHHSARKSISQSDGGRK